MSHWVVIYDIRDPKRLQRVAKTMADYGTRVQQSVFEMECGRKKIDELRRRINKIIDEQDYVVYFNLCEPDWQKREKFGKGKYEEEPDEPFKVY